MRPPFSHAAWPAAGGTADAGLWLAYRTFPRTWREPYALCLANSQTEAMPPRRVASDRYLSPPVLATSVHPARPRGVLAWLQGPAPHTTLHVRLFAPDHPPRPARYPLLRGNLHGLAVCVDRQDRFWLAWTERGADTGRLWCMTGDGTEWDAPFALAEATGVTAVPVLAAAHDRGVWAFWHQPAPGGFALRYGRAAGDPAVAAAHGTVPMAPGTGIDLDPAVAVDAAGLVVVTWLHRPQRWDTTAGYRLNEETQLHAALYDPARASWHPLGTGNGTRVAIPAAARNMPVAGRETLDAWAGPTAQRCFLDAAGQLRILYRRLRDVHGAYDWGFDLWAIAREDGAWQAPHPVSHAAGHPEAQYCLTPLADGGVLLVYEYANLAPVYLHMPPHRSRSTLNQDRRSSLALIRLAWGGPLPPINRIGPPRAHSLRPGTLAGCDNLAPAAPLTVSRESTRPLTAVPTAHRRNDRGETCYFGDLHVHTDISRCMPNKDGNIQDHLRYVREYAQLDFWTVTDHLEDSYPAAYRRVVEALDMHRSPAFAPLYGMEYTHAMTEPGYATQQDLCLFTADREVAVDTLEALRRGPSGQAFLDLVRDPVWRGRLIVARHFHGGFGEARDPDEPCNQLMAQAGSQVEPVVEIVQFRGAVPALLNALLQRGLRKGVIGGTDHGRPRARKAYARGRTGVWAQALDGPAVMDALYRRRTFATNGPKMLADLQINGRPMGAASVQQGPVHITGWVAGTTDLQRVILFRDGVPWRERQPAGPYHRFAWRDDDPIPVAPGCRFYWLHAVQAGSPGPDWDVPGELWSSACWVERAPPAA